MQNNPLSMISMLSQSSNPMGLIAQMYGRNPNYQQVMQIVQGKSPQQLEQYVRNLCQTQGIDLQSLARQYNLPL